MFYNITKCCRIEGTNELSKLASINIFGKAFSSNVAADTNILTQKDTTPGRFYHELVFRGRQTNKLALGDLRKLLQKCDGLDTLKYAVLGVELYQRKGQDFSEEVNSHFIKACLKADDPMRAVPVLLKYKNRIGAWTTVTSLSRLSEGLLAKGEAAAVVDVLEAVTKKGLLPGALNVELALKAAVTNSDPALFQRAAAVGSQTLTAADAEELLRRYPAPPAPPAPALAADPAVAVAAEAGEVPPTDK